MAKSKAKDDTFKLDESTLVPMLKRLETIQELPALVEAADSFLVSCRFAADKVATLRRDIKEKTDAKSIKLFCWNVLLSGQGHAVLKW